MSRRSTPQKKIDHARFPIFIRVVVPEEGFGYTLDNIHVWLREKAGNEYAIHSDSQPGVDCMAIYLKDPVLVLEIIEQFELVLAERLPSLD